MKSKEILNLLIGYNELSYELSFWSILIENISKQNSGNALRVETSQFCSG